MHHTGLNSCSPHRMWHYHSIHSVEAISCSGHTPYSCRDTEWGTGTDLVEGCLPPVKWSCRSHWWLPTTCWSRRGEQHGTPWREQNTTINSCNNFPWDDGDTTGWVQPPSCNNSPQDDGDTAGWIQSPLTGWAWIMQSTMRTWTVVAHFWSELDNSYSQCPSICSAHDAPIQPTAHLLQLVDHSLLQTQTDRTAAISSPSSTHRPASKTQNTTQETKQEMRKHGDYLKEYLTVN